MTACEAITPLWKVLADADARFQQAEYAYAVRTERDGPEPYGVDWPEGIRIDSLSDDRWSLEELAVASCDEEACAFAQWRRRRDGLQ